MPRSTLQEEIEDRNRILSTAFEGNDAHRMAEQFTADAKLFPPRRDVIAGVEAIAAFWERVFELGIDEFELETLEVEDWGDIAIEVGRYTLRTEEGILDEGTSLVIWKHEHGEWKLYRDIWNSNTST